MEQMKKQALAGVIPYDVYAEANDRIWNRQTALGI